MDYTATNVEVSVAIQLSTMLRDSGYDILWHESGVSESQTAGLSEPRDTITLVEEIPANPSFVTVLKDRSPKAHEIAVPALSVRAGGPIRGSRVGIGHTRDRTHFTSREITIDGFAKNPRQWKRFEDLLFDWVSEDGLLLKIWDYESDESNPPELDPAEVPDEPGAIDLSRFELDSEVYDVIRYYIRLQVDIRYVE